MFSEGEKFLKANGDHFAFSIRFVSLRLEHAHIRNLGLPSLMPDDCIFGDKVGHSLELLFVDVLLVLLELEGGDKFRLLWFNRLCCIKRNLGKCSIYV